MLDICDLLELKGFNLKAKTKMVRHQSKNYDFNELCRRGMLEVYQSYQSKPVFECKPVLEYISQKPLIQPQIPVQTSVLYCFRYMFGLNHIALGEVCNCAGDLQYPVICTCT